MRLRLAAVPLLCLGLIGYFAYYLVAGDHGIEARARFERRITALKGELDGLQAIRRRFERDVALMRGEKLDPDMLDERARAVINFAHPDDIVIMQPKTLGQIGR